MGWKKRRPKPLKVVMKNSGVLKYGGQEIQFRDMKVTTPLTAQISPESISNKISRQQCREIERRNEFHRLRDEASPAIFVYDVADPVSARSDLWFDSNVHAASCHHTVQIKQNGSSICDCIDFQEGRVCHHISIAKREFANRFNLQQPQTSSAAEASRASDLRELERVYQLLQNARMPSPLQMIEEMGLDSVKSSVEIKAKTPIVEAQKQPRKINLEDS